MMTKDQFMALLNDQEREAVDQVESPGYAENAIASFKIKAGMAQEGLKLVYDCIEMCDTTTRSTTFVWLMENAPLSATERARVRVLLYDVLYA